MFLKKICLYSCDICGEKFRRRHNRDSHAKLKHEFSDIIIDETNIKELSKDPSVMKLLEEKRRKDTPNFVCKLCNKVVMYGRSAHIAKHNAEKDGLKCPKCDMKFSTYTFGWFELVSRYFAIRFL